MIALLVQVALAQEPPVALDFDSGLLRPSVDSTHTIWTDDTGVAPSGSFRGGLSLGYANDPVVWVRGDETELLVSDALLVDATGAWTVDRLRLGFHAPAVLGSDGSATNGGGLGDLAADVRYTAVRRERAPVGFALGARLSAPTATVRGPFGSPGMTWELQAVADKQIGPALVALNVGTRGVPTTDLGNVVWNDQLFVRAGAGLPTAPGSGVSLDFGGRVLYGDPVGNPAANPFEVMVGGWRELQPGLALRGGVGTGVTRGVGAPQARALVGLAWTPPIHADVEPEPVPAPAFVAEDVAEPVPEPPPVAEVEVPLPDVRFAPIWFPFDSAEITDPTALADAATVLEAHPALIVEVHAHADERGTDLYNVVLSEKRAAAVVHWLVVEGGVDPDRLRTIAHGESVPAVEGEGEDIWAKNRRVELVPVDAPVAD
jgi:peptidoglycan-associated lipoprotein